MFGPKPTLRFYSANTAFRATGRQPPHLDIDFAFPAVPFGYCVNINLVATSAENGATEVWLGSHLNDTTTTGVLLETDPDTGHRRIRADLQDRRRNELGCPPVQPSLPKGALVIRDFRLWHAGMPNRTDEPRVMLVSVQFPSWYRSDLKMKLPASIKDKMRWGDLVSSTRFARRTFPSSFPWMGLPQRVKWSDNSLVRGRSRALSGCRKDGII